MFPPGLRLCGCLITCITSSPLLPLPAEYLSRRDTSFCVTFLLRDLPWLSIAFTAKSQFLPRAAVAFFLPLLSASRHLACSTHTWEQLFKAKHNVISWLIYLCSHVSSACLLNLQNWDQISPLGSPHCYPHSLPSSVPPFVPTSPVFTQFMHVSPSYFNCLCSCLHRQRAPEREIVLYLTLGLQPPIQGHA